MEKLKWAVALLGPFAFCLVAAAAAEEPRGREDLPPWWSRQSLRIEQQVRTAAVVAEDKNANAQGKS